MSTLGIKATPHDVTPGRTELVARAVGLQPLLQAHAAGMHEKRRLAEEVNTALVDAGMFRLMKPRPFGGYEADLRTVVEVVAALGEADGSTAWLVGVGTGTDWMLGRGSAALQDAVFGADPHARLAGSFTPAACRRVDGGVRMSGRWSYATGSHHATWASIAAVVRDDDGSVIDAVLGYVPVSELTLKDTWYTVGMRATGSNTFLGEEVFVPEHMLTSMAELVDDARRSSSCSAIHRLPLSGLASLMLVAPIVGIGRAALDLVVRQAAGKSISQTTYTRQSDSVGVQIQIAEAALKLSTAQLHLYGSAEELDAAVAHGDSVDYDMRAQVRARAGYAAQQVLEAIQILDNVHGAGSFAEPGRLLHYWRDANTAARHAGLNVAIGYEIHGKALLGVKERIGPLI